MNGHGHGLGQGHGIGHGHTSDTRVRSSPMSGSEPESKFKIEKTYVGYLLILDGNFVLHSTAGIISLSSFSDVSGVSRNISLNHVLLTF